MDGALGMLGTDETDGIDGIDGMEGNELAVDAGSPRLARRLSQLVPVEPVPVLEYGVVPRALVPIGVNTEVEEAAINYIGCGLSLCDPKSGTRIAVLVVPR